MRSAVTAATFRCSSVTVDPSSALIQCAPTWKECRSSCRRYPLTSPIDSGIPCSDVL